MACIINVQKCYSDSTCKGNFVNPLKDICWSCLFPITIGSAPIVSGRQSDTENPISPIQICEIGNLVRPGIAIGYWEPFAVVDVTRTPYCLVNLGGAKLDINYRNVRGSSESFSSGTELSFYQVHWYQYPLIKWLNIFSSTSCFQQGDLDIPYLSELDPTWNDDSLSFLVNPEAGLFSNPIAQVSCAADAASATIIKPINSLFWCMGSQGATYPLSGHISAEYSPLENSTLLTERVTFKLHRIGLIEDSVGKDKEVCKQKFYTIMPKNRYRYEIMNPSADANSCHAFGSSAVKWQVGKLNPAEKGNYGYLIWRKRNCVVM